MCQTERNRKLSELVLLFETGVNLSETIGMVEELSTWNEGREKKKRNRGKQCATSNTVNTDWSHFGDCLKEPATGKSTR